MSLLIKRWKNQSLNNILWAEDLGIPHYKQLTFQYDVVEFATAIKPFCFEYFCLSDNPSDVIYLDPDIYVYKPFDELFEKLKTNAVIVTPHLMVTNVDTINIEIGCLRDGIYNLGFLQ